MRFSEQLTQPKTRIILTLVSACMALACLFPPWATMDEPYTFPLWNKFLFVDHQGDKIDSHRLLVELAAIAFSGLFIAGVLAMFRRKALKIQSSPLPEHFEACPFCSEQIRPEAIKCRFCGEWLEQPPSEAAPHSEQKQAEPEASASETCENAESSGPPSPSQSFAKLFSRSRSVWAWQPSAGLVFRLRLISAVLLTASVLIWVFLLQNTGGDTQKMSRLTTDAVLRFAAFAGLLWLTFGRRKCFFILPFAILLTYLAIHMLWVVEHTRRG